MKDIVIIGAGGFGREVAWLIERINNENPHGKSKDLLTIMNSCGGSRKIITKYLVEQII